MSSLQTWFQIQWQIQSGYQSSGSGQTPTTGQPLIAQQKAADTLQILECDCLMNQRTSWGKNVTQYSVEDGKPISDSVRKQPIQLEVQIFHSSSPVIGVVEQLVTTTRNLQENGLVDTLFRSSSRLQEFYAQVMKLYEHDDEVTVVTRFDIFKRMVVQNVELNRSPQDGDSLAFTITFQEVNKATSATTEVPKGMGVKPSGPDAGKSSATDKETAQRAGVTKNSGQNTGSAASAADASKSTNSSLLSTVVKAAKEGKFGTSW